MPSRRNFLATVAVGSLGALAGCLGDEEVRGDWPRAGFDNRNSGYAPQHQGPGSNPKVKWSTSVPEGYYASSPVLVDDRVYVGYANDEHNRGSVKVGVRVLDIETGETKDNFPVTSGKETLNTVNVFYRDSVVYADGNLYVQAFDGVHSLTADGEKRWHVSMNGGPVNTIQRTAHPVVTDGLVYAPTASITEDIERSNANEGLYAIDDSTGKVVWKYISPVDYHGWTYPPAYVDGVVYLSVMEYGIVALDGKTGDVVWQTQLKVDGPPTIAGERVYVSAEINDNKAGAIVSLDAETGNELWRATGRGTRSGRRIGAAGGKIYYSENLRNLVALNATTGDELWRYSNSAVEIATPAVTDDAIYAGIVKNRSESGVAVLDPKTGKEAGFIGVGNRGFDASIALSDSLAVVTANSSEAYAFEPCSLDIAGHCLY